MAEDEPAAEPLAARRGQKNLAPLDMQPDSAPASHSSRWRRSRSILPPPPPEPKAAPPPPPSPSPSPSLQLAPHPPSRHENRRSLFGLFSRPKVERARGHHESGLPTIPDAPDAAPATAASPVTSVPPNTLALPADQRAVTPRSRGSFNRKSRAAGLNSWEPPPLSQAYPHARKHALLQATNSSAEAIVSSQAHKKQYNIIRENLQSRLDLTNGSDDTTPPTEKLQKRETKRMSTASSFGASDMTYKVYVLSASGCLLQYSGDGAPDRMPEKFLQLGKDSAAFACDLIPGKHWVLQVSQSTADDGTVTAQQPRSLLSRLRMQGTAAKRPATILLLVFDAPKEMGEWLTTIRQEIDILAGRKTRSEVDQENNQADGSRRLTQTPSHRYYVNRNSGLLDDEHSPKGSPVGSPVNPSLEFSRATVRRNLSDAASTTSRFTLRRRSVEASSMATISYDGTQLNQLREDSQLSLASKRTSGTSLEASIGPSSPVLDCTPLPADEGQFSPMALTSSSMSPSTNPRRISMPMQPLSPTDEGQSQGAQRYSTLGAATAGPRRYPAPAEDGHKSPILDGSAPRTIKNRKSFSRPFNLQPSQGHAPMPTIRSASVPFEKMDLPTGQAVSTDAAESPWPRSTPDGFANPASSSTPGQTPSLNPGLRLTPMRPTGFVPARRTSSLGLALPINVNPTPALKQRSSQPQLPTQAPARFTSQPPRQPLPPVPAPPPKGQLPPTPQQLQSALRRPVSMQVRSEPAAFLSTRRPMGVSTRDRSGSIEQPVRPSTARPASARPSSARPSSAQPPAGRLPEGVRFPGQARLSVHPMRSMPVLGLPPPAPPPNMPLPAPPPNAPLPPPPTSPRSTTPIKTAVMA